MNKRRRRNFGLLGSGLLVVAALAWLRHSPLQANPYPWLALPLILLGGYLEGMAGAVGTTLLAGAAVAAGHALGFLDRETASAEMLGIGLACGTAALFFYQRESQQHGRSGALLPLETKLMQVERKVQVIRGQMDENEAQLRSLAQLYDAAKKLVGILELTPLLDEARTLVAKTLPGHFGGQAESEARLGFFIPGEDGSVFHRAPAHGHEVQDTGLPESVTQDDLRLWSGDAFNPVRVRDVGHDARFRGRAGLDTFRSLLVVPLVMHESLVGVMLLASEAENAFSNTDFNQAGVLGKQVVFALRKALLYREVQKLSITDNLTGLYVHIHFQERFRGELGRAERYRHTVGLILMDLDHFKLVNDEHGHPVGDVVLSEAAARIREAAGPTALVARYGGEEFAVLLPGASKQRALEIARAINESLKATPIDVGGARLQVTLSGGVSAYPEDALAREALIEAADQALYEAKRTGRDRIVGFRKDGGGEKKV